MKQVIPSAAHADNQLYIRACVILFIFSVCGFQPAIAQESEPAGERVLDEITVIATKRPENLQNVGITVNAFGEDQIREFQIRNVEDLANFTPGLTVRNTITGNMPVITIRGVGVTTELLFSQTPPSAAIHVDEVYYGSPAVAQLGRLDTQRIEVLKGPQGTLFGRNTTAGSINFISNKPQSEFDAGFEFTSSFYDTEGSVSDIRGFVTGALGDRLNGRIAVAKTEGDDFIRDLNDDPYQGPDTFAARLQLDWAASENLDVLFTLHGARDRTAVKVGQAFLVADNGANVCLFDQYDELTQDLVNCAPTFPVVDTIINDEGLVVPFAELQFPYDHDVYRNGFQDGVPPRNDVDAIGGVIRLDLALSDSWDLVSLTAFDDADVLRYDNYIYRPTGTSRSYQEEYDEVVEQFSQELRLAYTSDDGSIEGLLGAFLFTEEIDHSRLGHFAGEQRLQEDYQLQMTSSHKTDTWAVFADGQYNLTDQLAIVGGLRYTSEEKQYTRRVSYNDQFINPTFDILDPTHVSVGDNPITGLPSQSFVRQDICFPCEGDWDDVDWKIGLNYAPQDNVLLYGLVSNGFKGGVFIGSGFTLPDALAVPADPENLTSYELGIKSELLNRTLRVNASVYSYDYTDMQVSVSLSVQTPTGLQFTTTIANVEQTDISGADIDLLWLPTDNLTLGLAASIVDGVYDRYIFTDPFSGNVTDRSGQDVIDTPDVSITALGRYNWRIGDYDVTLGAEIVHLGDTDFSFRDADTTLGGLNYRAFNRKPITTGNVRLQVKSDAGIGLSFFVNNVTDEEVVNSIRRSREAVTAHFNAPRTFGVRLTADF